MFYIQSGDAETAGWYLREFLREMPIWSQDKSDAHRYNSVDDTASDERVLETHGHLCFIVPA